MINYIINHQFLKDSITFFQEQPFYSFIVVTLHLVAFSTTFYWMYRFIRETSTLKYINSFFIDDTSVSVPTEERDEDEEEGIKGHLFLETLINAVIQIIKNSKEISIDEIRNIVSERIYRAEKLLRGVLSSFLFTGLFFTVWGLFQALLILKDIAGGDNFTSEFTTIISNMLEQFRLSFFSTMWGIIFASIVYIFYLIIVKMRQNFEFELLVYIKNSIVPKYSIPDTERDIGKLVKSMTKSSNSLSKSALSIDNLAKNTKLGTDNIVSAVDGFVDVTDKMNNREIELSRGFENISDQILKLNQETTTIRPAMDALLSELTDKDNKHAHELGLVRDFYNNQITIEKNISDTLSKMEVNNTKLAEFFGNNLYSAIENTIEKITSEQSKIFITIKKELESIVVKLKEGDFSKIQKEFSGLSDSISLFKTNVKQTYLDIIVQLRDLQENNEVISSRLGSTEKLLFDIGPKIDKCNELNSSLVTRFTELETILSTLNEDISNIDSESISAIESKMEKILKEIKSMNDIKEEIAFIKKRVGKLSGKNNFFGWFDKGK